MHMMVLAVATGLWAIPALAASQTASLVSRVAGGAISIPEPSNLALLFIGVAGLIIGRRASRNRRRDEEGLDG